MNTQPRTVHIVQGREIINRSKQVLMRSDVIERQLTDGEPHLILRSSSPPAVHLRQAIPKVSTETHGEPVVDTEHHKSSVGQQLIQCILLSVVWSEMVGPIHLSHWPSMCEYHSRARGARTALAMFGDE